MYTGTQARDWDALHAQGAAAVRRAEAGMPWEQDAPRTGSDQEVWLISFVDVLTLLLTLFVLLLAYQKHDAASEQSLREPVTGQAVNTSAATPADIPSPQTRVTIPVTEPATAAAQREVAAHATPPTVAAAAIDFAQADFPALPSAGLASLYLTGRDSSAGDTLLATETPYPLEWLASPDVVESPASLADARESAADPEAPPEPADAPLQRLLADLEQSALSGRVEVNVLADAVNLEISDNILFAPASAAFTRDGRALLDELAATLKTLPYELSVEGHTDNVPIRTARYPSNWELAAARASSVTRHLIEQGVGAGRVRAIGYADTRPRADNTSPEGRARNRRVSFILRLPVR